MNGYPAFRLVAVGALALAVAACGLKGPLVMPEKSKNVVIRGPQAPAGATTTPVPATGTTAPAPAPAAPTAPAKPATPPDDRMPPPPLPGGNSGSSRGG